MLRLMILIKRRAGLLNDNHKALQYNKWPQYNINGRHDEAKVRDIWSLSVTLDQKQCDMAAYLV